MWKQLRDSFYEINTQGTVRNSKTKKEIKPRKEKDGYLIINLWSTFKGKTLKVHRLVAECFLENPLNKPHVNHKDSVRDNNNLGNLEWCTEQENILHGIQKGNIDLERLKRVHKEYTTSEKAKLLGRELGLKYKHQTLKQYQTGRV